MNKSIMERMVFVTGFARGGTSWLRDCIKSHPEVAALPRERVVFRDMNDPEMIRNYFQEETKEISQEIPFIVNKAPANAPFLGFAAESFPESKFIFIIRDPRDVLVSHQRGQQSWMGGANSTVKGCMSKLESYYAGWLEAKDLPNTLLVRYEDLHQNFYHTMQRVFNHIGLSVSDDILKSIYTANNFQAQTSRANVEDRAAAKRKGVIGEWALQLTDKEIKWYQKSDFFKKFMEQYGYGWTHITYENILKAMSEANVNFLSEDDLICRRLDQNRVNVVVQHDIDYLTKKWCFDSVKLTVDIDSSYSVPAAYNLLPIDDMRYKPNSEKNVPALVKYIFEKNRGMYVGLHVNSCERYYPANAPDEPVSPKYLDEIIQYTKQIIADYKSHGIGFKLATAHGYGRGSKLPNNKDTKEIQEILNINGITLFDTEIRSELSQQATHYSAIADIGGVLKTRWFNNGYSLVDPRAYTTMPKGSFVRFLTHPGNYSVDKPATVVMRHLALE